MIKFDNVSLSYGNDKIIDRLSFAFESGKKYALMGESGIGKTTLLGIIAGTIKGYNGELIKNSNKVSYAFQDARLFPWLTVLQNVVIVAPQKTPQVIEKAKEILLNLGLSDVYAKYPDELSGGMKQRVSLARALMYDFDILLLDEPFRALDQATASQVAEYVFKMSEGKTVIFVTHDKFDKKYADYILEAKTSPINELRVEKCSNIITE